MPADLTVLKQQNQTAILSAMSALTQTRIAERSGISETRLSRMKETGGDVEIFALLLAACNLAVVPRTYTAIDPDKLRALKILAREALAGEGFDA